MNLSRVLAAPEEGKGASVYRGRLVERGGVKVRTRAIAMCAGGTHSLAVITADDAPPKLLPVPPRA